VYYRHPSSVAIGTGICVGLVGTSPISCFPFWRHHEGRNREWMRLNCLTPIWAGGATHRLTLRRGRTVFPHHIEIADNKVAVALTADTSTAPPWPLDADRFGRSRRIRARTDPDTDRRGARACESEGCNSWSKAKAYRPSATRGDRSPGGGRSANGHCALIQREPQHD
jgi:hypothetical protein